MITTVVLGAPVTSYYIRDDHLSNNFLYRHPPGTSQRRTTTRGSCEQNTLFSRCQALVETKQDRPVSVVGAPALLGKKQTDSNKLTEATTTHTARKMY